MPLLSAVEWCEESGGAEARHVSPGVSPHWPDRRHIDKQRDIPVGRGSQSHSGGRRGICLPLLPDARVQAETPVPTPPRAKGTGQACRFS
ncbi:unnamed protein product [Arctogadus glacialis]